jgi:hypothetical protein
MAKQFASLDASTRKFIENQKIFFVATAGGEGKVNLSPKGMDTFRILNDNRIMWLNLTGSGNETAAHLLENGRMTIMFCAFEGKPLILRLYGTGTVSHPREASWNDYIHLFPNLPGTRQLIDISISLVQTSCGMGVPYFAYCGERPDLNRWAEKQGEEGLMIYRDLKNKFSLDGKKTGL